MDGVAVLGDAQLAVWGLVWAAADRAHSLAQSHLDGLLTAREASLRTLAARTGLREDIALRVYGSDVDTEYAGRVTDTERDLTAIGHIWDRTGQALYAWAASGERPQGFSASAAAGQLDDITARYQQAAVLRAQARPEPAAGQPMTEARAIQQIRAATAGQLARLRQQYG